MLTFFAHFTMEEDKDEYCSVCAKQDTQYLYNSNPRPKHIIHLSTGGSGFDKRKFDIYDKEHFVTTQTPLEILGSHWLRGLPIGTILLALQALRKNHALHLAWQDLTFVRRT